MSAKEPISAVGYTPLTVRQYKITLDLLERMNKSGFWSEGDLYVANKLMVIMDNVPQIPNDQFIWWEQAEEEIGGEFMKTSKVTDELRKAVGDMKTFMLDHMLPLRDEYEKIEHNLVAAMKNAINK